MKRPWHLMLALLLVATLCVLPACSESVPSYLSVSVTEHPVGGLNVRTVSCTYDVKYTGSPQESGKNPSQSIMLNVRWTNDKGGTYNEREFEFGYHSSEGGSFTTTFSAPEGLVLDKTFWAVFSWEDSNGKHEVTSNKAAATVVK